MKQLSLSASERTHIIAALCVTSCVAIKKSGAGARMRLSKKILRSLSSK